MHTARHVIGAALEKGLISDCAPGYAEPGYQDPETGILFANWNDNGCWVDGVHSVTDRTMPRLAKIAERAGYETEWEDEWATCCECGKAVRTSPDCYSWKPSYYLHEDCEVVCRECTVPASYLQSLEGCDDRCVTFDIDPAEHGYVLVKADMQNGWHPGQSDSPQVVASYLRQRRIDRFLFTLDEASQFYSTFSVWVHESEADDLMQIVTRDPVPSKLPYDPGTEMGKALRGEPTKHYHVTTREITPEEFVSGSWTKDA